MKKRIQFSAAAAFLALATWLFIWPAFGPYVNFVLPLPGTTEIQSIQASDDRTGDAGITVKYFFKGRPVDSRFEVVLGAGTGETAMQIPLSGYFGSPVKGTHTVRIKLPRPWSPGPTNAFDTNSIEVRLVASENQVVTSKKIDFTIKWPDRKAYELNQLIANTPRDEIFKQAQSLIEKKTTRSIVLANTYLKRLVRKEPTFSRAVEQLVYIESVAPWGIKGSEAIDTPEDMQSVVNDLVQEDAYPELDLLGKVYRETKALNSNGVPKLRLFHKAVHGDYSAFKGPNGATYAIERSAALWSQGSPQSHIPKILEAKKLMREAWQVRGTGYASSVPKENFERFHELIKQSVVVLSSCRAECNYDPEWYATLLLGLRLASVDRSAMTPIFVEGFTKFPWYQAIYWQMATAYSPKWGGSNHKVESFARELASKFPATDRDAVYATLYNTLLENGESFYDYDATKTDFDCVRGVEGHKQLVDKWPTKHNLNVAARVASNCGNKLATRTFLKQVDSAIDLSVWTMNDFTRASVWAQ